MIELKLTAKGKEQELIKKYLQDNVSDTLAEKINNGVKITKDNKSLLSKKDLTGFMKYASEEARKQAEKGANSACVEDNVVFGWAIHYFEEDSIEGILYNEDGTEYKPVVKTQAPKVVVKPTPPKEEKAQQSLFDFMNLDKPKIEENKTESLSYKAEISQSSQLDSLEDNNEENDDDWSEEDMKDALEQEEKQENHISPEYQKYLETQEKHKDSIITIRLGDFYEFFGECAKQVADILDLTLTSRDVGLENKVALAGIPYHIKDKYFDKITLTYSLVVIENDSITTINKKEVVKIENNLINMETGELIEPNTKETNSIDKEYAEMLGVLLNGKLEVK